MTTPKKQYTQQKQKVSLPKYQFVGTPLKGEIQKMSVGEREDFLVDNLGDFLHQFCDKKVKITTVTKLIQEQLNKLYKGKTDDQTMLKVLDNPEIQTHIWNQIASTLGIMSYTQYLRLATF